MPTSGTSPLSRANSVERAAVEAGDDRHVDVAGPPAAALGEQHDRQPAALGELEQAVLLEVVAHALGAGQHGVVVGHRPRTGCAVDRRPTPADQPVGGRARDQLLARSAGAPGRRTAAARTRRSVPSSTRSARFSRAVRRPRSWRLATASARRGVEADLVALADRVAGPRARRRASAARRSARRAVRASPSPARAIASSWPSLDGVADARRRARRTTPSASATTSCSIFIASSTTTAAPGADRLVGLVGDRDHGAGERRDHLELLRVRHQLRACQPSARTASRISSGEALSLASCAMCDQATVPSVRDQHRSAELRRMAERLGLNAAGLRGRRERLRDDLRTEQLAERRHLRPGGLVAGPRLVGEHRAAPSPGGGGSGPRGAASADRSGPG